MEVKLIKRFGIHESGATLEANDRLYKHLLKRGFIATEKKAEKAKKDK